MNNYGLGVKLEIKPIGVYDGEIIVRKIDELKGDGRLKVRVYEPLENAITDSDGSSHNYNSLIMTPKSSFFWSTEGGSRPWTYLQ